MKLKRFVQVILGIDHKFFDLFETVTKNLVHISNLLDELVKSSSEDKRAELANEIDKLESIGDKHTHDMSAELSANFITPFDREDIHALISSIDDVVDYINGSAKRIILYKQKSISPAMRNLAGLISECALELHKAIKGLQNLKSPGLINEACARIKRLENHADAVFYAEMSKLFEEKKEEVELLKVMEILQNLEIATDKCEDAAKIIESILMKNS